MRLKEYFEESWSSSINNLGPFVDEEDECCEDCTYWDKEERNEKMDKISVSKKEFMAYEAVREQGHYNMFTSEAVKATGIARDVYEELIMNYDVLYKKYMEKKPNKKSGPGGMISSIGYRGEE